MSGILMIRHHHMGGIDIVTSINIQPVSVGAARKTAGEVSGDFHTGCPPNAFRIYRIHGVIVSENSDGVTPRSGRNKTNVKAERRFCGMLRTTPPGIAPFTATRPQPPRWEAMVRPAVSAPSTSCWRALQGALLQALQLEGMRTWV